MSKNRARIDERFTEAGSVEINGSKIVYGDVYVEQHRATATYCTCGFQRFWYEPGVLMLMTSVDMHQAQHRSGAVVLAESIMSLAKQYVPEEQWDDNESIATARSLFGWDAERMHEEIKAL